MTEYTTLQVSKKTRAILDSHGKKRETYDDIINKLIKNQKGD